jgi:predicted dehydrogenase
VLVDKPITTTYAEAKELEQLAKTKAVVLYAFQNRRWDADYLTLKRVIKEGILGNISDFETQLSPLIACTPARQ